MYCISMNINIFFITLLTMILSSCSTAPESSKAASHTDSVIYIEHFGNGNMEKELIKKEGDTMLYKEYSVNGNKSKEFIMYNGSASDELYTGCITTFYDNENNNIKIIKNVVNGLQQGEEIRYYENGRINHKGYNYKGKKDGLWVWYYENGKKWSEVYYSNDTPFGQRKKYYRNGLLKSIQLLSYDNKVIYWRNLDSMSGRITEEKGIPFMAAGRKRPFYVGDTVTNIITMAYLPGWNVSVKLEQVLNNKRIIIKSVNSVKDFIDEDYGKELTIKVPASDPGKYLWELNISVYDSQNNTHFSDIKPFSFMVK